MSALSSVSILILISPEDVYKRQVYNVVLPLLYNDIFREEVGKFKDFTKCIKACNEKDKDFTNKVLKDIKNMDEITNRSLGISLLNKDLNFEINEGVMSGNCNTSKTVSYTHLQTVIRINNLDETIELGKQLGELLKPNMLITLSGDLGAGKTTFTKGIGLGLEIKKIINSPTFTILKQYQGRLNLSHFDAYRLEGQDDDLGFEEIFDSDDVLSLIHICIMF